MDDDHDHRPASREEHAGLAAVLGLLFSIGLIVLAWIVRYFER